jgi:hypothetical protein
VWIDEANLLYSVPVDRCRHHGVWFDANELALVLARSTTSPLETDVVVTAASAYVDVGLEVTAVVAEGLAPGILEIVVEGALEILGAIFSAIDL